MNSRSSWGCEPIRKQRMRHKGICKLGHVCPVSTSETEEIKNPLLKLKVHARGGGITATDLIYHENKEKGQDQTFDATTSSGS